MIVVPVELVDNVAVGMVDGGIVSVPVIKRACPFPERVSKSLIGLKKNEMELLGPELAGIGPWVSLARPL